MKTENSRNKRSKTKRIGRSSVLYALMISLLLFLIGFQVFGLMQSGGKETTAEAEAPAFPVTTVLSDRGAIQERLRVNGEIIPVNTVLVHPEASGKVVRLTVEVGEAVERGQVIAWVDPSKPGMRFSEHPVKAPIRGTVTSILARAGTAVGPSDSILKIGDLSLLRARAYIPEKFIPKLHIGMGAEISLDSLSGRTVSTQVSEISPVVDPVSRSLEIKLDIPGENRDVKAGMYSSIELITADKMDSTLIPSASLRRRGDSEYVYLLNPDETVSERTVTTGIRSSGTAEVLSGLDAGKEIILSGLEQLSDGSRIRLLKGKVKWRE